MFATKAKVKSHSSTPDIIECLLNAEVELELSEFISWCLINEKVHVILFY